MTTYLNASAFSATSTVPAVVLGESFGALAVVRDLGKQGIPVYAFGRKFIQKSRYAQALPVAPNHHFHGQPAANLLYPPVDQVQQLIELSQTLGERPVLFTDSDNYLKMIGDNLELLSRHYRIPVSPQNRLLTDKKVLSGIARQLHIPVPAEFENENQVEDRHFPIIVKPLGSIGSRLPHLKHEIYPKKAYLCFNRAELNEAINELNKLNYQRIIQQYIPGDASTLYSVLLYRNRLGAVSVGFIAKKQLSYPANFGVGTIHITCHDPLLLNTSAMLLEYAGFEGIAELEFKYSAQTNQFYLIEVNGRIPLQYGIVQQLLPTFTFHLYHDLIHPFPFSIFPNQKEKPMLWLNLLNLAQAMTLQKVSGTIRSTLLSAVFFRKYRMQVALHSCADPLPSFYFGKYLLQHKSVYPSFLPHCELFRGKGSGP